MKKTILLTGATDGIGLATAEMLIDQGQHLLLHGRNEQKLEDVAKDLSAQIENAEVKGAEIETYVDDLSELSEVQKLADEVTQKHGSLDVLINNAGVFKTPEPMLDNGLDVRFVVNTLAPYLLTQQLLPLLGNTGRVVNLSSAAQAPVDIEALAGRVELDDMRAYSQSKLAITMWSRIMAEKLKDGPMIVAVNPGSLLASKMVTEGFGLAGNDIRIGADILTRAALSSEFADASGKYFDNDTMQFASPHQDALDQQKSEEVVQAIEALLVKIA
jgi:NAD(P)-dependent dehydrogenase (short-subunit alcohol dehydrogenase family)